MPRRPLRIGLYGPYGSGNLGDAAIQESMIRNLRQRLPDTEFLGISLNPENTTEIHGIEAFPIRWSWRPAKTGDTSAGAGAESRPTVPPASGLKAALRRSTLLYDLLRRLRSVATGVRNLYPVLRFSWRRLRLLRGLDHLVISGGGQLSDDWGDPWHHPFAMLAWSVSARLAGTRVSVLSVGAGPIRRPLSRRFFHLVLRLAHARSYRDEESRDFLSDLACTRDDPVRPDLAFALPVAEEPAPARMQEGRVTVGIATMSFYQKDAGVWADGSEKRFLRHEAALIDFVCDVLDAGHRVHLFYTQIRSDHRAFDGILRGLAERSRWPDGEQLVAEPTCDLDHLVRQIGATDLVISARLHGLILPLRLRRPVIALSYQPKVDALLRTFGLGDYRLCIDEVDRTGLGRCFGSLLEEFDTVSARVDTIARDQQQSLAVQFDRILSCVTDRPGAGERSRHRDRTGTQTPG